MFPIIDLLKPTGRAQSVLQVWVNLNLLVKLLSLDLDKCCSHGLKY